MVKGAFSANLFGLVQTNSGALARLAQFVWADVKAASHTTRPRRFAAVVSVCSQANSGVVSLWWESRMDEPQDFMEPVAMTMIIILLKPSAV